jgi:hypothetical protein
VAIGSARRVQLRLFRAEPQHEQMTDLSRMNAIWGFGFGTGR